MKRNRTAIVTLFSLGEPIVWLSGGALVLCLGMILGLLLLIFLSGAACFWPGEVVSLATYDNKIYMGEITRTEQTDTADRILVRTGNFKLTHQHFQWVDEKNIKSLDRPDWAFVIERLEWGRFYGFPLAFVQVAKFLESTDPRGQIKSLDQKKEEALRLLDSFEPRNKGVFKVLAEVDTQTGPGQVLLAPDELDRASKIIGVAEIVSGPDEAWQQFNRFHDEVRNRWEVRRALERVDIGKINYLQEEARLDMKQASLLLEDSAREYSHDSESYLESLAAMEQATQAFEMTKEKAGKEYKKIRGMIDEINGQNKGFLLLMRTAGEGDMPAADLLLRFDEIVRAYPANQLTFRDKLGVYASRWWEYLSDEPREANSEGGVFPAIFGTVVMTLMMALVVAPFGVLAALYLKEYAKAGFIISAVRIAVTNLAGVPSIVFGVFGLGFFCYGAGGFLDGGPAWTLPNPTWFAWLALAAIAGALAFLSGLRGMAKTGEQDRTARKAFRTISITLWILCAGSVFALVAFTPFFEGFYRARLPSPTFGKGGLIWASFTLALMTLPVVVVATEEALSSVPNSMREGSFACGAGKWQTIRRIVLPRALPGIMTGMILAMARGAGEVAPLMLVGAVKLAPELPFDAGIPEYAFGMYRSFMHLGFHIYDVGFQSQNSEAAKPMVYMTTLLLILIIALLNISAIWLRTRLKKKFVEGHF
ncbi:MAG: ABC transporter permease subunit [Planctomycetota bacterium]